MSIWWQVASRGFSMTLPPRAHATRSMELSATYELESSSSVLFSSAVSHSGSSSNSVIRLNMALTGTKSHAFSYRKSRNFFKETKKNLPKAKILLSACFRTICGADSQSVTNNSMANWRTSSSKLLSCNVYNGQSRENFQFFPFKKKPFQKHSIKFNLQNGKFNKF